MVWLGDEMVRESHRKLQEISKCRHHGNCLHLSQLLLGTKWVSHRECKEALHQTSHLPRFLINAIEIIAFPSIPPLKLQMNAAHWQNFCWNSDKAFWDINFQFVQALKNRSETEVSKRGLPWSYCQNFLKQKYTFLLLV